MPFRGLGGFRGFSGSRLTRPVNLGGSINLQDFWQCLQ